MTCIQALEFLLLRVQEQFLLSNHILHDAIDLVMKCDQYHRFTSISCQSSTEMTTVTSLCPFAQ
jgi:hypothetical protein